MQKHKNQITDFDNWYQAWQVKMREDKILKWLVDSRNQIVKQGDLETESSARVSLIYNWFEPKTNEFSVSPFFDSTQIADLILKFNPPKEIPRNSILKVERRWITKSLKEIEILEALIYCFDFYADIIFDAHTVFESLKTERCNFQKQFDVEIKSIKDDFMLNKDKYFTSYIDLSSGNEISTQFIPIMPNADIIKESEKRYNLSENKTFSVKKNPSLKEEVEHLFNIAKKILVKDGFHVPTIILSDSLGRKEIRSLQANSKRDYYLTIREIANLVKVKKFTRVIMIGENWAAKQDDNHPEWTAIDYPDKMEALSINAIDKSGEEFSYVAFFKREKNIIKIGPTSLIKEAESFFFNPIKNVWAGSN